MRTGTAQLPLHGGKAPRWLFERMIKLAREVLRLLVEDQGPQEVLRRLADPFWFQAFGCVLGFDWHSSGVTTTVCGAVARAIEDHEQDFGFLAAGGKGNRSRQTPNQLRETGDRLGFDPSSLIRTSKLTAKVDSAAVQDGYQVHQHMVFAVLDDGTWGVVQQGMNDGTGMARRYHWIAEAEQENFVSDPHAAVCSEQRESEVLNLVAAENDHVRDHSVTISHEHPDEAAKAVTRLLQLDLPRRHAIFLRDLDWKRLASIQEATYEAPPEDYAALLTVPGMGPKSLRALALVSELLYGDRICYRDPARYSFAHGGKDGIPYPVDRTTYDQTVDILRGFTGRAKLDVSEKEKAFKRLARFERSVRDVRSRTEREGTEKGRGKAVRPGQPPQQLELF